MVIYRTFLFNKDSSNIKGVISILKYPEPVNQPVCIMSKLEIVQFLGKDLSEQVY